MTDDLKVPIVKYLLGRAVQKLKLSEGEIADLNGFREFPLPPGSQANWKAAPRDGVWATPPFLHNGSVPNLYEMLIPASQRTKKFYVGRDFDPVKVGVDTSGNSGTFLMDTSLLGNSNAGHSFENGPLGQWHRRPAADRSAALGAGRISEVHSRRSRSGHAVWWSAERGDRKRTMGQSPSSVSKTTTEGFAMSNLSLYRLLTATAAAVPAVAFAHTGLGDGHDLVDGFMHPLTGIDHVLAMVAVGVIAVQLGGRALWAVPLSFVATMAIAGFSGIAGVVLPGVEAWIALLCERARRG